ncbi:MAG: PfkB family carbohydrate kinase [Gemmatimonadaceae bacterium]
MSAPRVVALGELLLRLKSPGHERLMQSGTLEASFGGAEANVAAALATDGVDNAFDSALTTYPLGDAAIGEWRRFKIDTSNVVREDGRIGTYYLEAGAGQRRGRVVTREKIQCLPKSNQPHSTGIIAWPARPGCTLVVLFRRSPN